MSKIIRLTKEIYNRIAAGEVVERPFSVVKELVENSIDAGAKDITIRLEDGGKKLISVKDDGCGIEKDDLVNATMPHATSKIQTADDLDKIVTLGFRGEALASIASVSEMTITSKVQGAEIGYYIESKFGVLGDVEPFPTDNGTTIEVKNLFQNTPAREKFLKPSKTEETDIINIITRLIFSHPEISFKLFIDGNERDENYKSTRNPQIDKSKTYLNYHTMPYEKKYLAFIDERIKQLSPKRKIKGDAVLITSFILGSNKEFFDRITAEQQKQFFADCTDFFSERYGKENVVSAVVHLDESTPHLHLNLMPVTDGRLCAK